MEKWIIEIYQYGEWLKTTRTSNVFENLLDEMNEWNDDNDGGYILRIMPNN